MLLLPREGIVGHRLLPSFWTELGVAVVAGVGFGFDAFAERLDEIVECDAPAVDAASFGIFCP